LEQRKWGSKFFFTKSCTCTLNDQRYLLNGALQEFYYAGNAYLMIFIKWSTIFIKWSTMLSPNKSSPRLKINFMIFVCFVLKSSFQKELTSPNKPNWTTDGKCCFLRNKGNHYTYILVSRLATHSGAFHRCLNSRERIRASRQPLQHRCWNPK